MKLPSDDHVLDLFGRLERHARTRKPSDTDKLATYGELKTGLLAALRRDRGEGTDIDGYPSSTSAEGSRGSSELTSVEAATESRVFGFGPQHDVLHEHVEAAYGYLVDAVQALGALQTRLDLISRMASPLSRSEAGGAGTCLGCGEWVSGAAEDRLKRGLGPCCYSAWVRAGRPDMTAFVAGRRAS